MPKLRIDFTDVTRTDNEESATTYYGGMVSVTLENGARYFFTARGSDRGGTVWDYVVEEFARRVLARKLTDADWDRLDAAGVEAGEGVVEVELQA